MHCIAGRETADSGLPGGLAILLLVQDTGGVSSDSPRKGGVLLSATLYASYSMKYNFLGQNLKNCMMFTCWRVPSRPDGSRRLLSPLSSDELRKQHGHTLLLLLLLLLIRL